MLAQLYDPGPSYRWIVAAFIVVGVGNAILTFVFLRMGRDIGRIRTAVENELLGTDLTYSGRLCQFCEMPCPIEAKVCYRCGREIGAWRFDDAGLMWRKQESGAWEWRYPAEEQWYVPDQEHMPPA